MQLIGGIFVFIMVIGMLSSAGPAGLLVLIVIAAVAYALFHPQADELFVKHPAESIIGSAIRTGKRLDIAALQDALMPSTNVLGLDRPFYHYSNQAKKARALKQQLDEDAALAHAAILRERARAELKETKRQSQASKRRRRARRS